MLVSLHGPTPFTRKECNPQVEFFTYKQLFINITKHSLVPKHELVTNAERQILKDNYALSDSFNELPKILCTDPICQYYAFSPGDIVRITRTIGTTEPLFFYRYVC